MFLCYDIKGIQRFIFSVPRLKCIVGGSALIDAFDSKAHLLGGRIFTGGGRGAFQCASHHVKSLEDELRTWAWDLGLDIQFGCDDELAKAAKNADRFYPYAPLNLEGFPCEISGYLPTKSKGKVNEKIALRMREGEKDTFGSGILEKMKDRLPDDLKGVHIEFFRNVSPESALDEAEFDWRTDQLHANAAINSIGRRNRWAVIAMDGNDIGLQFAAFQARAGNNQEQLVEWLTKMSDCMKQCTRNAFIAATLRVLDQWVEDTELSLCSYYNRDNEKTIVLPIRPLILGGDDVVLLCHSMYAFEFVRAMSAEFERESITEAEKSELEELWPASGNRLTMSAGVLFTNLHLPLHSAIPYAEALLKNAKGVYRKKTSVSSISTASLPSAPSPAAIDFDVVTDSLLDTPAERRRRELVFIDNELDCKEIRLTKRPYRLDAASTDSTNRMNDTWGDLNSLANELFELPKSIRSQLLPMMRRSWSERVTFLASIAKRYPEIKKLFMEEPIENGDWVIGDGWFDIPGKNRRESSLADALLLLEEEDRTQQVTI